MTLPPFAIHVCSPLASSISYIASMPHKRTPQSSLHPVPVSMHYVLGVSSVCLCWSRQSWACPTDNHEEEETEELSQQRQQQCGHRGRQETQPRHQLQPLQSGTCKHQLHSGLPLFYSSFLLHLCQTGTKVLRCFQQLMSLKFKVYLKK